MSRATESETLERLAYVMGRLDADPLLPAAVLVAELQERYGLGRSRSYELLKQARDTRATERIASPDWDVIQENRRQYLLDLQAETEQALYAAKLEGNRSAQGALIRQLLVIEQRVLQAAPLETFRSQLEHSLEHRQPF